MNQRLKKMLIFSASALMFLSVGTGLANISSNVHAESIAQKQDAIALKSDRQYAKKVSRFEDRAAYIAAKNHPSILANDLGYHPNWIKGHKTELLNRLTPKQRLYVEAVANIDKGNYKGNYAPSIKAEERKLSGKKSLKSNKSTRSHKSKIPKQLRNLYMDNKSSHKATHKNNAIRNDKKQLSTRNGKKFVKLINRYPKRAMRIKGAKRYLLS